MFSSSMYNVLGLKRDIKTYYTDWYAQFARDDHVMALGIWLLRVMLDLI